MRKGDLEIDPRGLFHEAFRMAIGPHACRSIFLDWAMGLPRPVGPEDLQTLLDRYADTHPDHPMTAVLREGLTGSPPRPRRPRRGGARG